jgi:acyl carrier protein
MNDYCEKYERMQSQALICDLINEVLALSGKPLPQGLSGSTNILQSTGIDSLELAEIVMRLEEATGKDPFRDGFINFQTVGELAALYET